MCEEYQRTCTGLKMRLLGSEDACNVVNRLFAWLCRFVLRYMDMACEKMVASLPVPANSILQSYKQYRVIKSIFTNSLNTVEKCPTNIPTNSHHATKKFKTELFSSKHTTNKDLSSDKRHKHPLS
jgi:hypothetical protein